MYKDDIWYTKFTRAVEERKDAFSNKQIEKYKLDFVLRLAKRVKDYSDRSETCRGFQHTLTRLEEEMGELPDSKAQRDYQKKMLREISEYFVKEHRLAPPTYYARKWTKYGGIAGLVVGLVASIFVVSNIPLVPVCCALGLLLGLGYGSTQDNSVKQQGRLI